MNATTTGTPSRRRAAPRGSHTHLHGRALGVARLAWLAVAALTGTVYAASVWAGLRTREGPCPPGVCLGGRVPAGVGRAFAALHLPVGFLGGYTLALNVVFALVFAAVAALIFSRRSRDLLALFVSLTLLVFGAAAFESDMLPSRLASLSAWHWPVGLLGFLGVAAFGAFLCVFPDGRFVPRWTLLAAGAWALWVLPAYILPDSPLDFNTWPAALSLGAWALFLGAFVVAQAYRYRRVSTPAQRVQTKWVVLGLAAAAAGHFGGMLLRAFQPAVPTSAGAVLGILAADTLMYVSVLLIPLAIAVAMLRHHLFDVDLVIRLTLLYSALAAILALVYESGVVIAAKLAVTLTGESGLAAEVLAAFGAGVLAGPVHRWLGRCTAGWTGSSLAPSTRPSTRPSAASKSTPRRSAASCTSRACPNGSRGSRRRSRGGCHGCRGCTPRRRRPTTVRALLPARTGQGDGRWRRRKPLVPPPRSPVGVRASVPWPVLLGSRRHPINENQLCTLSTSHLAFLAS